MPRRECPGVTSTADTYHRGDKREIAGLRWPCSYGESTHTREDLELFSVCAARRVLLRLAWLQKVNKSWEKAPEIQADTRAK